MNTEKVIDCFVPWNIFHSDVGVRSTSFNSLLPRQILCKQNFATVYPAVGIAKDCRCSQSSTIHLFNSRANLFRMLFLFFSLVFRDIFAGFTFTSNINWKQRTGFKCIYFFFVGKLCFLGIVLLVDVFETMLVYAFESIFKSEYENILFRFKHLLRILMLRNVSQIFTVDPNLSSA